MAIVPSARSFRFHHAALLLTITCLAVVGCVRGSNSDNALDQIKRPARSSTGPVVSVQPTVVPESPKVGTSAGDFDTSWYRPRSSWSGQSIDVSNIDPMQPIYRITVHHSGDAEDALGDPAEHLRLFERVHKSKGWACIGYHFVVSRDGTVYEARPIKYQGAHATGDNNIGNIGICLMGNFDNRPIPAAQRKALEETIARLRKRYGIARDALFGHRDFKTTDCPGRFAMDWLETYKDG